MAWIGANDFYQRALLNDLVSLRALRAAVVDLAAAKKRSTTVHIEQQLNTLTEQLNEIDGAIKATEALLASGAHHG